MVKEVSEMTSRMISGRTVRPGSLVLPIAALVIAGLLLVAARPAYAATFTVNVTGDGADLNLANGACDASPSRGSQCTLRAAIQEANDTAGEDTIRFNIPGTGVKTIKPSSELPAITESVTIDGYTQPGASKNTLARGTNAKLMIELDGSTPPAANGLVIGSDSGTTIRGLVINNFRSGPSSAGNGIVLGGSSGPGNRIEGNFIGTNPAGTAPEGNAGGGGGGVVVEGDGNVIGGTSRAARNLISDNGNGGVFLDSASNDVLGNLIGTDRTGIKELGNSGSGIKVFSSDNAISGNTIAFSRLDGVSILLLGATGNEVGDNSIFANEDLGIDLGDDGQTTNDPSDTDAGANGLQNHPEISSATTPASGATTVQWSFDSAGSPAAQQTYTVRFFSNPADTGEGKTLVDTRTIIDDSTGPQFLTSTLARSVPAGQSITATATDAAGNTSEFSLPRLVRRH
jgi:CSLREA domain-containing protein